MALINCPECGEKISDRSYVCIKCGYPIKEYVNNMRISQDEVKDVICYPELVVNYVNTNYHLNPFMDLAFFYAEDHYKMGEKVEDNRHKAGTVIGFDDTIVKIKWKNDEEDDINLIYDSHKLHSLDKSCFEKWEEGTELFCFLDAEIYIVRDIFSNAIFVENRKTGKVEVIEDGYDFSEGEECGYCYYR